MTFYKFSQIIGRLSRAKAAAHKAYKANVPDGIVRTNYPDMYRFRSTFDATKKVVGAVAHEVSRPASSAAATGLPTEFTLTGFPKFPKGTRIGKTLIMGEYGPYSPRIRALQDLMQKDPSVNIALKMGGRDALIYYGSIALLAFGVFIYTPAMMYTLVTDKSYLEQALTPKKQ